MEDFDLDRLRATLPWLDCGSRPGAHSHSKCQSRTPSSAVHTTRCVAVSVNYTLGHMKQPLIRSNEDASALILSLKSSAARALDQLCSRQRTNNALHDLWSLKFGPSGCDPLDMDRPMNLIEQLNQTFTYLASVRASQLLLRLHPELAPFKLNLGTTAGWDIESSIQGELAAEVFAAVNTSNNRKLAKDRARISAAGTRLKYVFFMCPGYEESPQPHLEVEGVRVWALAGTL